MIEISQKNLEELAKQLDMPEYPKYIGNGLYKLSETCITGRMGLEKFWELMKEDVNMDKATKVAVEKYPHGTFDGEIGDSLRAACAVGYMQAQKDLALTWEDVRAICDIELPLFPHGVELYSKEYYEKVLQEFNKQRRLKENKH